MNKKYYFLSIISLLVLLTTGCNFNKKPASSISYSAPSYDYKDPTEGISFDKNDTLKNKLALYKEKIISKTLNDTEMKDLLNALSSNDMFINKVNTKQIEYDKYDYDNNPQTMSGDNFEFSLDSNLTRDNSAKTVSGPLIYKYKDFMVDANLNGNYSLTYNLSNLSFTSSYIYEEERYNDVQTFALTKERYQDYLNLCQTEAFIFEIEQIIIDIGKTENLSLNQYEFIYDNSNNKYALIFNASGNFNGIVHEYKRNIDISENGEILFMSLSYEESINNESLYLSKLTREII